MPFLTKVHFQNYRSFLDAKCRLRPVTLVIGANNAGNSNFLRNLRDGVLGEIAPDSELLDDLRDKSHQNHPGAPTKIILWAGTNKFSLERVPAGGGSWMTRPSGTLAACRT